MAFKENLGTALQHLSTKGAFLTVSDGETTNTMTIAWGYIGFMWGKPCFMTMVRPQRYTFDVLKKADTFTVSVPFGTLLQELEICGTKSGRDIDKSKVVSFLPSKTVKSPVVAGCDAYFECRIIYKDALKGELMPEDVKSKMYIDDFHHLYYGEIVESY